MTKIFIQTDNAPKAIGNYSQAIRVGNLVYLSGQIPLDPKTMEMEYGIEAQAHRAFNNLCALASSSGGGPSDIVKLTIYLTDMTHFTQVNEIMSHYFTPPYPARAVIGVVSLPRSALVEIDAVMVIE